MKQKLYEVMRNVGISNNLLFDCTKQCVDMKEALPFIEAREPLKEALTLIDELLATLESEAESLKQMKQNAELLEIFLTPWGGEESKTECAERLAKKMPKGKQPVMIRLLESAWLEGYDTAYKLNFSEAINSIKEGK